MLSPRRRPAPTSIKAALFLSVHPQTTQAKAPPIPPLPDLHPPLTIALSFTFFLFFTVLLYLLYCSVSPPKGSRISSASAHRRLASKGLDPAVVWAFPASRYGDVKQYKAINGELECGVCVQEFSDDEKLRFLPHCWHVFHRECIERFLQLSVHCPVCYTDVSLPVSDLGSQEVNGEDEDSSSGLDGEEDRHALRMPLRRTETSSGAMERRWWRRSNGKRWL